MLTSFSRFCFRKVNTTVPSTSVIPPAVQQPVSPPGVTAAAAVTDSDNADWPYDPNEPRYCICNQVSYGDMVACDNSDVSIKREKVIDEGRGFIVTFVSFTVSVRMVSLSLRRYIGAS